MAEISTLSNQTIWQPVKLTDPIDGAQDLTSTTVELALVLEGNPGDDDWFPAAWEAETDANGFYLAYAEVGPNADTIELEAGNYRIWVRVTLPTETPVIAGEFVLAY